MVLTLSVIDLAWWGLFVICVVVIGLITMAEHYSGPRKKKPK